LVIDEETDLPGAVTNSWVLSSSPLLG